MNVNKRKRKVVDPYKKDWRKETNPQKIYEERERNTIKIDRETEVNLIFLNICKICVKEMCGYVLHGMIRKKDMN